MLPEVVVSTNLREHYSKGNRSVLVSPASCPDVAHKKRLPLPIGQRTPDPFQWSEGEVSQPHGAEYEVQTPYCTNDQEPFVELELAVELPRPPREDELADQASQNIVAERSAAHRSEWPDSPRQPPASH